MKNYNNHIRHLVVVAFLFVSSYSLPQVKDAFAQAQVSYKCPAGYTCVSVNAQPVDCPPGFLCVKNSVSALETSKPDAYFEDKTSGKEEVKSSTAPRYCYTFGLDLNPSNLKNGVSIENDSGVALFNLQTLLEDKQGINIDNSERDIKNPVFGVTTKDAVKEFQRRNGIPTTGYVGPITRGALNRLYGCDIKTPAGVIEPRVFNQVERPAVKAVLPVEKDVYANASVSNVIITNKSTGGVVTDGDYVKKGETYTISWEANSIPQSGRFTLTFQSPSNPSIYGVIRTGLLDYTKRSYDWVIDNTIYNSDFRVSVEVGGKKAYSKIFKVMPESNTSSNQTPNTESVNSSVVTTTGIKSVYPLSGIPGTKVTINLSNPNKYAVDYGDLSFGVYSLSNFSNSNNEVITFTVPNDAKPGIYEIVWFDINGGVHKVNFTTISQSGDVSHIKGWHSLASVMDSLLFVLSVFI